MKTLVKRILVLFSVIACFMIVADLCGMDAKQRVAIIKGLKLKGIVGESNQGLLEFRGADKTGESVVNEENGERTKVYAEIASKTGTSAAAVGAQRAAQLAQDEPAGVWIQDKSGNWKKK